MEGTTRMDDVHGSRVSEGQVDDGSEINAPGALFIVSATVNMYIFAVLVVSQVIKCLPRFRGQDSTNYRLDKVVRESALLLSALLIDYLLTVILVAGSIYCFAATDILRQPFLNTALPARQSNIIIALLAVNSGRYAFKLGFRVHTSGTSRKTLPLVWIDVMHHAVTFICFLVMIKQFENWISGLVFIIMDSDLLIFDVTRILKIFGCSRLCKAYTNLTLVGVILGVLSRTIVPIALLTIACVNESPVGMSPVSLATLFSAAMFLSIVNIWFIKASVNSYKKCIRAQRKANPKKSINPLRTVLVHSKDQISMPVGFGSLQLSEEFMPRISVIKNNLDVSCTQKNNTEKVVNGTNLFKDLNLQKNSIGTKKYKNSEMKRVSSKQLYTIPEDSGSQSSSA